MSNDTMPIKTLYLVFLFGSAVVAHPTTKQCKGDKCNDRQVALTKQTLNALQTMNSRLQSIEGRLHSMESRQESIERQVKEDNGDTRCQWAAGSSRTCYKLVHQKLTWSDGRAYCQSLADGADLVSIESQAENEFLVNMIQEVQQHSCAFYHTSGRKDQYGTWTWRATQQPFTYTGWKFAEPNNAGFGEDACVLWYDKSRGVYWNDAPNNMKICFICEHFLRFPKHL